MVFGVCLPHNLRAALQCLRQMCGLDFFVPCQIRDGACQFQDVVIDFCRQIHLPHRRTHQTLTFVLQLAKLPYLPDAHTGIVDNL